MPLSPKARELMGMPAGPRLVVALTEFESGPCERDHAGESPAGFEIRGIRPGLPCECQLVALAAWEAVSNWQQATATSFLVEVMATEPVTAPPEVSVAERRFRVPDPTREEVAVVVRASTRSVTNRLGNARMIIDHPELLSVAARGGCAFSVAKRIISDLVGYPAEDGRRVTSEVAARVNARLKSDKAPWDGAAIQAMARRLIAKLSKEADDSARVKARARRSVNLIPVNHGMAYLEAYLPEVNHPALKGRGLFGKPGKPRLVRAD